MLITLSSLDQLVLTLLFFASLIISSIRWSTGSGNTMSGSASRSKPFLPTFRGVFESVSPPLTTHVRLHQWSLCHVSAQAPRFFVIYDSQFPLASSRFGRDPIQYRVGKTHCHGCQGPSKRNPIFLGTQEALIKMVPINRVPIPQSRTVLLARGRPWRRSV